MSKPPNLRRELGLFDLTLLLVIAIVNINTLPLIASEGWRSLSLWIIAFLLFLIPQGIAVAEFTKRYPEEGGIYVWTKEMFGEFHAFISGWCYWTNNLFYYPSVLFILVGVLVYSGGPDSAGLASNQYLMGFGSLGFLWLITLLHVRGLGIAKWFNNIGAFGTWFGLLILVIIGITTLKRTGSPATPFHLNSLFLSLKDYASLSTFSVMLYALVGLELGSVMSDEIKDVSKIIGRAVFFAGGICIFLLLIGTASLLLAVPASQVGAIQGLMQAVTLAATDLNLTSVIPFMAVLFSLAVMGVCSAWIGGAARVPFVMGVSAYLPPILGRTHQRWGTPYMALVVQAVISSLLICLSLFGSNVRDAYGIMLSSSVVIQLVPFLYLFAGMWKLGKNKIMALLAVLTTAFGILFVFIPSSAINNVLLYEIKIIAFPSIILLLALIFYLIGKRKKLRLTSQPAVQ